MSEAERMQVNTIYMQTINKKGVRSITVHQVYGDTKAWTDTFIKRLAEVGNAACPATKEQYDDYRFKREHR